MLARDVMRLLFVLCILPFGGEVCRFRKPNGTRRCIQELAIGGLELIFNSKPGQIKGSSNEDQEGIQPCYSNSVTSNGAVMTFSYCGDATGTDKRNVNNNCRVNKSAIGWGIFI